MWKKEYWDNDGSLRRNIIRQDDGTSMEEIGRKSNLNRRSAFKLCRR